MWILISWLQQKPADLDLHFLKRVRNFEKVYAHIELIRRVLNIALFHLDLHCFYKRV